MGIIPQDCMHYKGDDDFLANLCAWQFAQCLGHSSPQKILVGWMIFYVLVEEFVGEMVFN